MTRKRDLQATPRAAAGRPRVAVPREYPRCVVRVQRKAGDPVRIHPLEGTMGHLVATVYAADLRAHGMFRAVVWPWQGGSR